MFGYYTPILLLQAFCVYHAYKNNAEQRWYWLIMLFPLIGCILYLVQNFNSKTTLTSIAENVKEVVNNNYRTEQLERALKLSDNVKNKINLADAYIEVARYDDAILLYQNCMQGFMADDVSLQKKLLNAHFRKGDFATAITYGQKLEYDKSFKDSDERVAYAWSLCKIGNTEASRSLFEDMDKSFTNY